MSLDGLFSRAITVKGWDAGGADVSAPARLAVCECGCAQFACYQVFGAHLHFQCAECGISYCDGTCSQSEETDS